MSEKDYTFAEGVIRYDKTFFGFLDILGFKNLLIQKGPDAPNVIFNIIKNDYQFYLPWKKAEGLSVFFGKAQYSNLFH